MYNFFSNWRILHYLGDQIADISKETNFKFITNNLENIEESN